MEQEVVPREALRARDLLILLISVASLVCVLWNLQDASIKNANTGSRYATVESLVDYGTFAIDQSLYRRTIDKVKLDDHYYSSKPPVLPVYAAGVYWVYHRITGDTFASAEGNCVRFCGLMSGWLSHLLLLLYLYRLSKLLFTRQLAIVGLALLGGFAYLGAGYATTLNNHSVAATLALIGFYYAVRIRRGSTPHPRHWLLSGLCLGFLPTIDVPSGVISAAVFGYLYTFDRKKTLTWFLPALLPGPLTHALLSYLSTGSVIPVYLRRSLYDYPGSYWNRESGIDALREPKHIYGFHVLFGHHGLFSMTPVFAFAVFELYRAIRQRLQLKAEAWLVASASAVLVVFYIFYSHNYGGWCVGMRWFVPIMPLLCIFCAVWLDRVVLSRLQLWLFAAAFAVSAFHVQDAMDGPFQYSVWHNWLENQPNRGRTGKKFNLQRVEPQGKSRRNR